MDDIVCRELTTMKEMELVKHLDVKIWNMDPVPEHQTITASKNGGIVLGAFDKDKLIGFSYSFPGFDSGKAYLCSHMLGIDPDYQSQGIGEQLKWKQRDIALDKGYEVIKWTYDPLETKNAKLNLSKLNAICHTYIENCYGEMTDKLNKGLPSDRFEVQWFIKSPHVTNKNGLHYSEATVYSNIMWKNNQPYPNVQYSDELQENIYSVEVARNFQMLKKENKELALTWRLTMREIFQRFFQAGYTACRMVTGKETSTYYLIKLDQLHLEGEKQRD